VNLESTQLAISRRGDVKARPALENQPLKLIKGAALARATPDEPLTSDANTMLGANELLTSRKRMLLMID
jgi:hypothetical protein